MKNYGTIENAKDITTKEYVDEKIKSENNYYIATQTVLNGTVGEITLPDGAEIKDGVIVSFVTPAAGLKMSGIKVGEYMLDIVDGRNRSVLAQAGFFAKDCRVSVILDITNSKAWLQNIAMIHVGDSVINNFGLQTNATVNDAFDVVSSKLADKADKAEVPTKTSELENDSNFVTSDEVSKNVWYGTCTISASAPSKTVTTTNGDFVLETGNIVVVYFKNTTIVDSPTLNVDGTGEKNIYAWGGTSATSTGKGFLAGGWTAGSVIAFVYDGAQFRPTSISSPASTTRYGLTQLSTLIDSTSTTQAATPSAVKQAYDLANSKATKASYTATLSATAWSGTSAPYTQSVSISGILATDNPHIMPIYSTTIATAIAEKAAWNCVSKAVTAAGVITFTCFEEMPSVSLSLDIELVR